MFYELCGLAGSFNINFATFVWLDSYSATLTDGGLRAWSVVAASFSVSVIMVTIRKKVSASIQYPVIMDKHNKQNVDSLIFRMGLHLPLESFFPHW